MFIKTFRILNYKSFDDSGIHALQRGFNVLIGQNNSGKTALVEALSLNFQPNPHRSLRRRVGVPPNPRSQIDVAFILSGGEARDILLASGVFTFPVRRDWQNQAVGMLEELLKRPEIEVSYRYTPSGGIATTDFPSHGLFALNGGEKLFASLRPDLEHQTFVQESVAGGASDSFGDSLFGGMKSRLYCFRAERLSLGATPYGERTDLLPDASNLAEVLDALQGRNPTRYESINRHVRTIFPTIQHIAVRPSGGKSEIIVWNVDPATEREDLAIPLLQSGTGIGQVLAILYVVVTSNIPRTIIIDEPNTFLHPGALRKLLGILQATALQHQYVITTHSPEVIASSEPQTIYMVRWGDGQSKLDSLDAGNVLGLKRALLEVGARLSDVFGADAILWVEGPTEHECFPKILKKAGVLPPLGTAIIPLRNIGDLEAKRPSATAIWEIYQSLSTASALMPRTLAFSLDQEGRSAGEMAELAKRSSGLVHFLPRLMYENYLLEADAIAAILSRPDKPITAKQVQDWIVKNAGKLTYLGKDQQGAKVGGTEWLSKVHGAKLLADLFSELSGATQEYRKMVHSIALTDWLLANRPDAFAELVSFLRPLVAPPLP
jgi:predicted ATPase